MRVRQLIPAVVVSLVASGVAELLYRGWTGAQHRWSAGDEEAFELYTYGLPAGSGKEVAELFCGKVAGLPVVVREKKDLFSLRTGLRYRRKGPAAALLKLPEDPRKPTPLEPAIHASLLLTKLFEPQAELRTLRRRLALQARASGAVPVLVGKDAALLAEELEMPLAKSTDPQSLAAALGELRGERPRCAVQSSVGR